MSFKRIAIIGASGAIGHAFLEHFLSLQDVDKIFAFSRSTLADSDTRVIPHFIDIMEEAAIARAAEQCEALDLVIVATGILHQGQVQPEKAIKQMSRENFSLNFEVNTIGPALVAKYFLPRLNKQGKMAFLSARVGSISDNHLGGWYAYRASKAALNMVIKNLSIEMARTKPEITIIGLHPGTVDSALSKPFQSNVSADKLFTPEFSVQKMIDILSRASSAASGKIFAWDGSEIGY